MRVQYKNLLALDPATKTGFYHSNGQSGVWDLSRFPNTSEKLVAFEDAILTTARRLGCDAIAFELASYGAGARRRKDGTTSGPQWTVIQFHNKLRGVIELCAAKLGGLPLLPIAISTAKSFATGSGRATKEQVGKCFERENGRPAKDENESDAWSIWVAASQGATVKRKTRKSHRRRFLPPDVAKRRGLLF